MKIKKGYLLRKTGKEYMVVAIGEAAREFNGLIRMNVAGAWLWEQLQQETTETEMVQKMLARYENLDQATAKTDLKEFLNSIQIALEA